MPLLRMFFIIFLLAFSAPLLSVENCTKFAEAKSEKPKKKKNISKYLINNYKKITREQYFKLLEVSLSDYSNFIINRYGELTGETKRFVSRLELLGKNYSLLLLNPAIANRVSEVIDIINENSWTNLELSILKSKLRSEFAKKKLKYYRAMYLSEEQVLAIQKEGISPKLYFNYEGKYKEISDMRESYFLERIDGSGFFHGKILNNMNSQIRTDSGFQFSPLVSIAQSKELAISIANSPKMRGPDVQNKQIYVFELNLNPLDVIVYDKGLIQSSQVEKHNRGLVEYGAGKSIDSINEWLNMNYQIELIENFVIHRIEPSEISKVYPVKTELKLFVRTYGTKIQAFDP